MATPDIALPLNSYVIFDTLIKTLFIYKMGLYI